MSKVYEPVTSATMCALGVFSYEDSSIARGIGRMTVLDALRYVETHQEAVSYPENFGLVVGDFSFAWDDETDGFVGYDESLPPARTLEDVVAGNEGPFNDSQIGTETWLRLDEDDIDATGPWPGGRPDED